MSDFNPETHIIIYLTVDTATGLVCNVDKIRSLFTLPEREVVERIVEKPKKVVRWE